MLKKLGLFPKIWGIFHVQNLKLAFRGVSLLSHTPCHLFNYIHDTHKQELRTTGTKLVLHALWMENKSIYNKCLVLNIVHAACKLTKSGRLWKQAFKCILKNTDFEKENLL